MAPGAARIPNAICAPSSAGPVAQEVEGFPADEKNFFIEKGVTLGDKLILDAEMIKDENADSLIKYLNAYKILDNYVFEYDALVENDYNSLDFHVIADKVEDNGLPMVTFADRDDVIECDRVDIPFVVMRTPIENDYKCMKINVSFDIFMHQDEEKPYSSVKLEILRKKDSGEMVYMSTEFVDLYRVGGYDKWQHWSIDEFLKHKKYHYKTGDVLVVRFSNFDKLPFYLSNVKATLSASK